MADLWLVSLRTLPVTEEALALLTPERAERVQRIRHTGTQRGVLAAGLLLRRVFGPQAEALRYTETGRPVLPGGPPLSLSHGGDYAALLTAESACGVDVEPLDRFLPRVARAFAPGEQEEAADAAGFVRLWTRKEALAKATGLGLTRSLLARDVRADTPQWHFGACLTEGHMVSWACAPGETVAVHTLSPSDIFPER